MPDFEEWLSRIMDENKKAEHIIPPDSILDGSATVQEYREFLMQPDIHKKLSMKHTIQVLEWVGRLAAVSKIIADIQRTAAPEVFDIGDFLTQEGKA